MIGCAVVVFVVVCALPGAYMFAVSFLSPAGAITVSNYTRLLSEPRQRELLAATVTLGAAASAVASMIGVPLGLALARLDLPCRGFLRVLLLVPLATPPYVLALAWTFAT